MQQNNKNILLATILSAMILISWTWLYEKPKMEKQEEQRKILTQKKPTAGEVVSLDNKGSIAITTKPQDAVLALKNRDEILADSKKTRVEIASDSLHGSISLKGARFDDLTLAKYFKTKTPGEIIGLFKEDWILEICWGERRGGRIGNSTEITK